MANDVILNTSFEADWLAIKQNKQQIIHKNNIAENAKCILHQYKQNDKGLLKTEQVQKYGMAPYVRPYVIRKVHPNRTVVIQKDAVLETINIRNIKPYHS